jgi:hypothetical protein
MGLFSKSTFTDTALGSFERSGGMWRGTLRLENAMVPLALSGSRSEPDDDALDTARTIAGGYAGWRPVIERELFAHYEPYAELGVGDVPVIEKTTDVWSHATIAFIQVAPMDGELTIEIGYRVAWDEEHTLGARFQDGTFTELCGSVLEP